MQSKPPILCDTCCVLMLLRIAPEMFKSAAYNCRTIPEVFTEIVSTKKFKSKYPWRVDYKKHLFTSASCSDRAIVSSIKAEAILECRGTLSDEDAIIGATALKDRNRLTTNDRLLEETMRLSFDVPTLSALDVLNEWIEKGLVTVTDEVVSILREWDMIEAPQPEKAQATFKKLTGRAYPP